MNKIFIDVNTGSNSIITVTEKDNLIKSYKIILTKNKEVLDLTNKKVKFAFLKDNTNLGDIIDEIPILNQAAGELDFTITNKLTKQQGLYSCCLAVYDAAGYLEHTGTFKLYVKGNLFEKISAELLETDNYKELISLLDKATIINKEINTLANNIEAKTKNFNDSVAHIDEINKEITKNAEIVNKLNDSVDKAKVASNEADNKNNILTETVNSATSINSTLANNISNANTSNTTLNNSLDNAKKYIAGLKVNQSLSYEGTDLTCKNTLEGRTEELVIKGNTIKDGDTLKSAGEQEGNKISISLFEKASLIPKEYFLNNNPSNVQGSSAFPSTLDLKDVVVKFKVNRFLGNDTHIKIWTGNDELNGVLGKEVIKNCQTVKRIGFYNWGDITNGAGKEKIIEYLTTGALEITVLPTQNNNNNNNNNRLYPNFNAKQSRKEIILPIQGGLKGLPNKIYDTIEQRADGVYLVQRIGEKILNGSENWEYNRYTPNQNNTLCFYLSTTGAFAFGNKFISDKFSFLNVKDFDVSDFECITKAENDVFGLMIRINKNVLNQQDVNGFKKWLQANPLIICYQLDKPIETKLDIKDLELGTFADITYVTSNNAVKPTLSFKVPSNLAGIVQQNAKNVNELYKLIDEVIIPQLMNNATDIQLLKLK